MSFLHYSPSKSGHNGMYGHCHLNGNNSVTTASATAVKVEGLNRKNERNG